LTDKGRQIYPFHLGNNGNWKTWYLSMTEVRWQAVFDSILILAHPIWTPIGAVPPLLSNLDLH
jgi:hypothetical protein